MIVLAVTENAATRAESTQRTPNYSHLNAARAVLALSVLLYHLSGTIALDKYFGIDAYAHVFGFGGARVPLFFALSGFVLTLVYARDFGQPHKTLSFLWRGFGVARDAIAGDATCDGHRVGGPGGLPVHRGDRR